MADPTKEQMQQGMQGQTGYGSGSDDFAQPGKTGNANGASIAQDAAVDANDTGDYDQAEQAGYGSNPDANGLNDDPNSTPAIGGLGGGGQSNSDPQMSQDEALIDDEDMDGANASSAGGGM